MRARTRPTAAIGLDGPSRHGRRRRAVSGAARAATAVLVAVMSCAPDAHAAADCDATAITWPPPGQALTGRASVYGSAAIDAFQFYKVEFASANAPETWSAVSAVVRSPARHARLDRWSTDGLPDGAYRLKLTVVDTAAQERCRAIIDDVVVSHSGRASAATADGAIPATGASPAARTSLGKDDPAPWPTAAAQRALLQATAVVTAEVGAGEGVTGTTATTATTATAATTVTSGAATAPASGDAAPDAEPTSVAALGRRFGVPFVLGFVVVAALMATLGRRAFRSPAGAGEARH